MSVIVYLFIYSFIYSFISVLVLACCLMQESEASFQFMRSSHQISIPTICCADGCSMTALLLLLANKLSSSLSISSTSPKPSSSICGGGFSSTLSHLMGIRVTLGFSERMFRTTRVKSGFSGGFSFSSGSSYSLLT